VSLGGNAVQDKAGSKAAELIGLAVAALALVITFGSLIAAGLPAAADRRAASWR
jgi:putative drug exporter of the RND superfamily